MAGRQPLKPFKLKSLKGWTIAWKRMEKYLGTCVADKKTIYLNPEILSDRGMLMYTVTHEGSHAIDDILAELKAELTGNFAEEVSHKLRDHLDTED